MPMWTSLAERRDRLRWRRAVDAQRTAIDAIRSAPATPVKVAVSAVIAAPAAQVWALRTDPLASASLMEHPVERTFVVPGTPEGDVGEQYCVVRRMPDRSTHVALHEVIAIEAGRRRTARNLTSPRPSLTTVEVEPLGEKSCTLRVFVVADAPLDGAESSVTNWEVSLRRDLWRLQRHVGDPAVTGTEPPPLPPNVERAEAQLVSARAAADQRPREPLTVTVSVNIDAPTGAAWDLVARNDSPVGWGVSCGCGNGRGFTVPGTPEHAVGEVRALLSHHASEPMSVVFTEVVQLDPGRTFATATPGTPYPHTTTFRFRAHNGGCHLDMESTGDTFSSTLAQARGGRRSIGERYLEMVRRHAGG
jgi:hypothetical protein